MHHDYAVHLPDHRNLAAILRIACPLLANPRLLAAWELILTTDAFWHVLIGDDANARESQVSQFCSVSICILFCDHAIEIEAIGDLRQSDIAFLPLRFHIGAICLCDDNGLVI
jgi:hypothetical protein